MIPHYVVHAQECEHCEAEILIDYEAILTDDGYFCSEECVKCHLYLMANPKDIYLTNDRIYRSVD